MALDSDSETGCSYLQKGLSRERLSMTGSEVLGRGRFQWNAGGWFGGALGGSAWMFLAAVMLTANDQVLVATVPAAAF